MNLKFYILKNLALINNDLENKCSYFGDTNYFVSSNKKEYSGFYITIPARCIFSFSVLAYFNVSCPVWLGISDQHEDESMVYINSFNYDNISDSLYLTYSAYNYSKEAIIYYIWFQYATDGGLNRLRYWGNFSKL